MNKRKIGIGVLAVCVGIVVLSICLRSVLHADTSTAVTYTVKKETYKNVISISGNIEAAQQQNLAASGAGTITQVYVQQGDVVKEGQTLIELDSLNEQYAVANQEYQILQQTIAGSKSQVALLQQQKQVLLQKRTDRTIYALYDGIIAVLSGSVGDVVVAQTALGTLIDRSYLKASVEVVETDAAKLSVGQKVILTFPAYSETVEGYVESFPAAGRITSRGATVVDAVIRIDTPPAELFTAYSFTGEIEITEPVSVLLIERYAVGYEQGKSYAEVIAPDGTSTKKSITVVPYSTTAVSIIDGLSEGDILKAQSSATKSGSKTAMPSPTGGERTAPAGGGFPAMM